MQLSPEEEELRKISEQHLNTEIKAEDVKPLHTQTQGQEDPVDLEAFAMLGGMVNSISKNINDNMDSVGNQTSQDGMTRISSAIKPITKDQVTKPVLPPDVGGAENAPVNLVDTPNRTIHQPVVSNQYPTVNPQQPVQNLQPQISMMQPQNTNHNPNMVFPANLQSVILTKILAIEKTHAKIIEIQKDILNIIKQNE